ncbi:hypothetical protein [Rathayibacter sp. AY1C5]|nr:hypothetical protein [Rathayibacter sp. AY1C5]
MIYRILPFLLTFVAKKISKSQKAKRAAAKRPTFAPSSSRRSSSRRGR